MGQSRDVNAADRTDLTPHFALDARLMKFVAAYAPVDGSTGNEWAPTLTAAIDVLCGYGCAVDGEARESERRDSH
jgi:hypothetical protein